ncbi:MAG: biotin transporter BioY [Planctomycetota bacterium]
MSIAGKVPVGSSGVLQWSTSSKRSVRPIAFQVAIPVLFCFLISVAAQVRILVPGTLIPMTLQSLIVLIAGLILPPSMGVAALLLYLVVGSAGAPVFASQLGLAGVTGGYLLAFPVSVLIMGFLASGNPASWFRLLFAGIAGLLVIFALGVWWASWQLGGWSAAVGVGALPFLPKAMIELVFAVSLVRFLDLRRFFCRGTRDVG